MDNSPLWQGLPYYPISQFYRQKFGEKVYKISVSVAETCPNREGLRGMQTCNFCDVWGSAAYPEIREKPLADQILQTREHLREMFRAHKFLVYFQAYTNTFTKTARLAENFKIAAEFEDVVGFVVGTRPDCISDAVMDLWNEYSQKKFVAVELGVQSFDEQALLWMRRGHTAKKSVEAIYKIREKTQVNLGIHLMFGLPGETNESMVEVARRCNELPIDNVKLHNLHVLKNTPLAEDFAAGRFDPIDRETYFERCRIFLEHLRPDIAVHRLSALSNRPGELVGPAWTAKKMETYQGMLEHLRARQSAQSQRYSGVPACAP